MLLLLAPMLWLTVAARYNKAFVAVADAVVQGQTALKALGSHISITHPRMAEPVSLDSFTLHFGLILLTVLVLAAVGIPTLQRVAWLAGMWAGMFVLHVLGVAALAMAIGWSAGSGGAGDLIFRLFAVFWGLVPAVIGGLWAFLYWIPRASRPASTAEMKAAKAEPT